MPDGPALDEALRIGVYACRCGGNISDAVDCECVAEALTTLPDVVVSRTDESMCSDAGQAGIAADIRDHGVNRVVIGACAPSLHEQTFRGTLRRAGLNPYLYCHVGLREQDSWVHSGDPDRATDKAVRLMRAGVARARHLVPLEPIALEADRHALVIGGGVAGLRAALDIARRGLRVTLVERSPFLGGRVAQLGTLFPTGEPARETLHELIDAVRAEPNLTIHTGAEVVGSRGSIGNFEISLRIRPRGVRDGFAGLAAAADACPVEVPDEHDYGLTRRKAIYRPYAGCAPATPAIDWDHCTLCGACRDAAAGIDLEGQAETVEIRVGAVVVATGFDPYEPAPGEFGYGAFPEVITLPQFIRLLARNGGGEALRFNGHPVRRIAMIHCVGSRQVETAHEPPPDGAVNTYCSRVCCTAALHAANEVGRRFPEVDVFDLYRDIRTYGRGHEAEYIGASARGVRFLRYRPDAPPIVAAAPGTDSAPLLVRVVDSLTWDEQVEIPADLVVLAVGMMPRRVDDLVHVLKISPGPDRFLLEVHPKLRPVETAVPGVVLAGAAQAPMNVQEACTAAGAAAAKVGAMLASGSVELDPYKAEIDPDRCDGAGRCLEVCRYEDAITLVPRTAGAGSGHYAVVTPANCAGCGACVGACPNRAVSLRGWTLEQYEAMVEAIVAEPPRAEVGA
jgi:heterodisulfide reductase subunit A